MLTFTSEFFFGVYPHIMKLVTDVNNAAFQMVLREKDETKKALRDLANVKNELDDANTKIRHEQRTKRT